MAESRTDADMAARVHALRCPVILVDGAKPLSEKLAEVIRALRNECGERRKLIVDRPGKNVRVRVSKKLFDTLFDEGLAKQSFIDVLRK